MPTGIIVTRSEVPNESGLAPHIASLLAGLAAAMMLFPGDVFAQECGLETRVPFAGHNLPLDGVLLEETLSFEDPFPSWNSVGIFKPTFMTFPPDGTNRLFIVERRGIIESIPNRPDVTTADFREVMNIEGIIDTSFSEEGVLGMAFHPDFASNGYFYLYYTPLDNQCANNSACARIVRYRIDPSTPETALPSSAFVVLEIPRSTSSEVHHGGMLAFGPDDYLYISVGDNDNRDAAQDTSSLRGKLLRIDVDSGTEFSPGLPADNPYGNAVWFYGLRNPWRFSFDRENPQDIWIADVGDSDREEVNWVQGGVPTSRDFGWPNCEGTLSITQTGCTASQHAPDLEYETGSGRIAVIGGYVYRGPLASLTGHYVFGDATGAIFSWDRTTRDSETGLGIFEERLSSLPNLASFAEDEAGEVYTWPYDFPYIGRFTGSGPMVGNFPTTLSTTGLFSDVASLTPAPGLIEYDVRTPLWSDDAAKKRWIALPDDETIQFSNREPWSFPTGTALVKHFELAQNGQSARRLETRVFLRQNDQWIGFTYRWNQAGTDANLLIDGLREEISLAGGGTQTWLYPSPSDCLDCHSAAAGRVLGVQTKQLNSAFDYSAVSDNQLHAWNCIGLFDSDIGVPSGFETFAALDDTSQSLASRARSYLHVNCSVCHQPGGTGTTEMNLRSDVLLGDMKIVSDPPIRGDLGLPAPLLVDPGNHTNSILSLRAESRNEAVRMARGTLLPDAIATSVLADWINQVLYDSVGESVRMDSDEDTILDASDNCPGVANTDQRNSDGGAFGDVCDPDQMPDIVLSGSPPTSVNTGGALNLNVASRNAGLIAANASQIQLRLSTDTILDANDLDIGDCFVGALSAGQADGCTVQSEGIPMSLPTAPGPHFWITCVDALDQVAEGDEANNCVVDPVAVPEPSAIVAALVALISTFAVVWMRRRV